MTWTQTYSGHRFDILNPDRDAIVIEDIAHSLALINRFNGHTKWPYSVAQHSVLVSQLVPEQYALHGLMHDAAEAYLGDIPKPWKSYVSIRGVDIGDIEADIDDAIHERFGLLGGMPEEVWAADFAALWTERSALMPSEHDWGDIDRMFGIALQGRQPDDVDLILDRYAGFEPPAIERMSWQWAEQSFLRRFRELTA